MFLMCLMIIAMSMLVLLFGIIVDVYSNGFSDFSLMGILFIFSVCLLTSTFFLPNLFEKMKLPKFWKDNKERSNV